MKYKVFCLYKSFFWNPGLSSLLTEPCFIRNTVQDIIHFQEIFLSNWLLINCRGAVLTNMQLHQQSFSAEGTLHHALQGRKREWRKFLERRSRQRKLSIKKSFSSNINSFRVVVTVFVVTVNVVTIAVVTVVVVAALLNLNCCCCCKLLLLL